MEVVEEDEIQTKGQTQSTTATKSPQLFFPNWKAHRTILFNPEYIKSYEHVHQSLQTAAYS